MPHSIPPFSLYYHKIPHDISLQFFVPHEIIETCFGTDDDRDLWAYYCYHHDIETILEKARELKSRYRQGEIRNPVTAFQKWLNKSYGFGT